MVRQQDTYSGVFGPHKAARDPIHGYIFFNDREQQIVDTSVVQRLRNIKQLAFAQYTYPGAEHSRFSHSLGVMHLAGILAEVISARGALDRVDIEKIRLGGLLHDIGHGPFSHIFEEVLLKFKNSNHPGMKIHEDITKWLIQESEIADILNDQGYEPKDIRDLAVGQHDNPYMNQILSSSFDVDKMDFLVRDSHFCGVEYGHIDVQRLIYSIYPLTEKLAVHLRAQSAVESLIIARFMMFRTVYFHKTVRAAEIMVIKAMELANDALQLTHFDTVDEFLELDDSSVLTRLRDLGNAKKKELKLASELIKDLERRRLMKCAKEKVLYLKDKFVANILSKESVREHLEEEIADIAKVDVNLVHIDVPTLPSIPYNPHQPLDIPAFEHTLNGKMEERSLTEFSELLNVLKGYMDVMRVYTTKRYRENVARAAEKIFEELPSSATISF